ncbi:MAG: hypothetical protein AAF919_08335 [Pseudomonadota bacterium]
MRACLALTFATLSFVAVGQTVRADPFDVAFWEQVIESPTCRADEFVAFLKDPRAWAHCPRRGDSCRSKHGELVHRLCGAGMEIVSRSACFRHNPGRDGRDAALHCLTDNSRWNASQTIWLEDHNDELPRSSRLRLSSEPESRTMPDALLAIAPLPPRVLGLSEEDVKDNERALEFWRMAAKMKLARVEAMIDALTPAQEALISRSLNLSDRRSLRRSLSRVYRHWNSEDGRFLLSCREFAAEDAVPDISGWSGWATSCRAAGLAETAGVTFRAVEILGVPR